LQKGFVSLILKSRAAGLLVFEELRFILGINALNAPLALRLNNVCVLSLSLGKGNEVLIDVRLALISLAPNKQYIFMCTKQHS